MSKKRKTSLWNRLEDSLGEPRDLAGPLKEVNSILRVKQTPMTYKTLHGILENHGVRVGALHGIGRFIDFLCFVDIAQGYPSPACMFETATGRIGGSPTARRRRSRRDGGSSSTTGDGLVFPKRGADAMHRKVLGVEGLLPALERCGVTRFGGSCSPPLLRERADPPWLSADRDRSPTRPQLTDDHDDGLRALVSRREERRRSDAREEPRFGRSVVNPNPAR